MALLATAVAICRVSAGVVKDKIYIYHQLQSAMLQLIQQGLRNHHKLTHPSNGVGKKLTFA